MRTFQICFRRASRWSIIDRIIAWVTHGPFVHVEIAGLGSFGEKRFSCHAWEGCQFGFDLRYPHESWEIIPLDLAPELVNVAASMVVDDYYDYLGVLRFICKFISHRPGRWFCSEITTKIIAECGGPDLRRPWLISPNELYGRLLKRVAV